MIIKASGRSALILATGLFVCFARPSQAAPGATDATASSKSDTAGAPIALNKYAKHGAHAKKLAHRNSAKLASKSSTDAKTADAVADGGDNSPSVQPSEIPPAVANANAQLASADAPTDAAKALAARANSIVQGTPDGSAATQPMANTTQDNAQDNTQVVSADQLNDVDRSLHENGAPTLAMASADAPAPAATAGNDSNTWDQTSLIGKIFIGFGALLTMASAARMFMA
jgi:hypothetical protein